VGEANINAEYTSDENAFLVLHDSKGFEPGDTTTFDIVSDFIKERRKGGLSLKDQLHAVWLCTETPRAGGRVFETGDEKLLQLARDTKTPLVVVFTKYDRLVRTKRAELREDFEELTGEELKERSKDEARNALESFANSKSVKEAMNGIRYANVSTQSGYDADISKLVDFTGDVVREKLTGSDAWIMWAIAQRAILELKIDAWLEYGCTAYYGRPPPGSMQQQQPLFHLLGKVHEDIITFWNFMDEKNILSSEEFQRFILLLVQDAEESRNQDQGHCPPSQAVHQISEDFSRIVGQGTREDSRRIHDPYMAQVFALADFFQHLLSDYSSANSARTQRLVVTYAADLTEVLRLLFDVIVRRSESDLLEKTSWLALKEAYEAYRDGGSRQRIHARICQTFQQDQQLLDPALFQSMFRELVKGGRQ